MQGNDVRDHQAQQHQRYSDHMEAEKAVQGRIADHIVAANQQRQVFTDERHGGKQVDDHLGAPVGHLAPGQQIAHESLGHQAQENGTAEDPDQFARIAVGAVDQAAEHMHVNDDEECRSPGRMHIADQPTPGHIAHDVLDRSKRERCVGLVMHHQEDAGDDLDHQHHQGERAENIEPVEVLRRVILGQMFFVELAGGETVVHPGQQLFAHCGAGGSLFEFSHGDLCA